MIFQCYKLCAISNDTCLSEYLGMASRISSAAASGKRFRETFKHATKDVLNFFPGHMAKGLQQMQKMLPEVDCIVEVHDARIPISGRNPRFTNTLMIRPHLLLLNKIDLANMEHQSLMDEKLKAEGIKKILHTNCRESIDLTIKNKFMPAVMELIESTDRYNRSNAEDFNVLVIGIPNVGKSSLINALRRTHLKKGGKATPVGARPGVTRSVMEKIRVSDKPKVYVYDTPGIMCPHIPNMDVGMKLALCGTVPDSFVGPVNIADFMLYMLNKLSYFKYVEHIGLTEPTDDIFTVLSFIAKQRNLVIKVRTGGVYSYHTDFRRAAEIMIHDFRAGLLGKVNFDEDLLPRPIQSAEVVGTADETVDNSVNI